MRHSLESRYRKYVQGQGFMSFAKNIGNKYGKKIFDKSINVSKKYGKKYGNKLLDNSLSAGKDFAKIASKKVLTKIAEATGDLTGNKIADRITKSSRNKAQKEDDRIMEETQEILNSLFNTYNENKSIRFKTPMLRSDLCDYGDAYILVNGTIAVAGNHPRDRQNRPLILKNNAPFISCIARINGELIEDADNLDIVMPMYNLLEHSKSYKKTVGSLYNYYRDELSDDNDNNNFGNIKVVNSNTFKYKNKIIGNTYKVDSTIVPAAGGNRVANPDYDANNSGKKM